MTLLAATDGSDFSQRVIRYSATLAAALSSPLDVCCVIDYISAGFLTQSAVTGAPDLLRDGASRTLDNAVKICESRNVVARTHLLEGSVAPEILRCSLKVGAHYIVMGTHGRGGLRAALFGSTAYRVIQTTHVPVIVVAENFRDQEARMFKHVVVGVDGSAAGRRAALAAFDLARQISANVYLCHVVDLQSTVASELHDAQTKGDMLLDAEASRGLQFGINASKHILRGNASDQLWNFAQTHEADLIALGTHGRHGLARTLLGSVAEEVIRSSDIPVLIVGDNQEG